jgi:hypothetical protein
MSQMAHLKPHLLPVAALLFGATLAMAACTTSSSAPTPVAVGPKSTATPAAKSTAAAGKTAPLATSAAVAATLASDRCPTAATVGAALSVTLPKPTGVAGGGVTALPPGATGLACEYAGKTYNVLIELITNIDPSSISLFSSKFPVPYVSVSGVGDQARSFSQTLGGGKDNEGVVATKGKSLVSIVATATPASLGQIEALVNELL